MFELSIKKSPLQWLDYEVFVEGCYLDVLVSYYESWGYKYIPAGCTIPYLRQLSENDIESLGDYIKYNNLDLIVLY